MISPTAHQAATNRVTAERWELFASHRRRVTQIVTDAVPTAGGPLCVLGAGNCNDLDLEAVSQTFSEIHLVDLDPSALSRGVTRQAVSSATLTVHGGIDVSGLSQLFERRRVDAAVGAGIDDFLHETRPTPTVHLSRGAYGAVLSATLLTQLLQTVVTILGPGHPRLLEVLLTVRDSHLRLVSDLLEPGGVGILVTDVVSSDTCPALLRAAEDDLLPALDLLTAEGNTFVGVNPVAVASRFAGDSALARSVTDVAQHPPWSWRIGPARSYLVYAITFRKGVALRHVAAARSVPG